MRSRSRRFVAVSVAVVVHGGALWLRVADEAPQEKPRVAWDVAADSRPIEITLRTPPPPAPPLPPAPPPPSPVTSTPSPPPSKESPQPPSSLPSPEPSSPSSEPPAPDLSPRARPAESPAGQAMNDVVVGLDAKGPRPSNRALEGALDFQPDNDVDKGLSGAALAAARAERRLKQDMSFDDVSNGLGDDWFHGVRVAAERHFRPSAADLDNPNEVTRERIASNYLRDPTSWDDEAKAALELFLRNDQLHSTKAEDRLPLGNSANFGTWTTSTLRRSTFEDLLRRKEAGLSVRFAFEVDVHHAADGAVTAVDVLRTQFEKNLVEQVRKAVAQAVHDAPPVPPRVAEGRPFKSHWLFVATWFIDPPRMRLPMTSSVLAEGLGAPPLMLAGTFDVGPDGLTTQDFDVKLKTSAELLDVTPLLR